jgi:hypothetical protein
MENGFKDQVHSTLLNIKSLAPFSSLTRDLKIVLPTRLLGFWVMGSKDFNFFPRKPPAPTPYKIANATTTPTANGIQYALMISGKCGYHLMELPPFRVGSVFFSGKGCKE